MKNRVLYILSLLMLATSACAENQEYPAPPPYSPHPSGEFPIIASYAFSLPLMNDTQFQWVKEAGFNTISQLLPPAELDSCLILAGKYGLQVVACPYGNKDKGKIPGLLARYKDNPNVWGFSLADEPDASKFDELGDLGKFINGLAPDMNFAINLLPDVGSKQLGASSYKDYVSQYVKRVNPPYICYDIYPVKQKKNGEIYVDPKLYTTIETIAYIAAESKRPFISYLLSNKHGIYPAPKEEYIRFQAFVALAYGAQGLKYYTYCMPDFDKNTGEYSLSPIDWNGKRTPTWNMVRTVNREVKNLEKVFLGAKVDDVSHTGIVIPEGTKKLRMLPSPFDVIDSDGEGLIVSQLSNGGKRYLVIVNRSVEKSQKVYLGRTRPVKRLYGDGKAKMEKNPRFTLSPGGYAVFEYN